ncbi:MAG: S9 family peptidase, partial [Hyphomicrobiales bacterium]|nr:S9 family peptidase [Hyphomicrobiales bacterium]
MPPEGPRPRPPRPKRVDAITRRHGLDSADPYAWLKAANWPEVLRDPATLPADIRGALEAEDAYAREVLAPLAPMRRRLVEEMRARMEDEDVDAPTPDGPWEYYCRHREGGQHEIVCRRPRGGGEEEVLLDADRISRGRPYFELHAAQHSPDHRLLAWSSDDAGAELRTIRVRDLVSGRDLPDVVGDTTGIVAWSRDARWFLYVAVDANHRASRVLRHRIGEPVAADAAVYEEADPAWLVDLDSTLSGDHAVVAPRAQDATEIRLVDLSGDGAATRLVLPRKAGVSRRVEVCGDRLIVLHDDGAPDFRIDSLALDDPSAPGRTLVPEVAGRTIRDFVARRDRLAWLEMEDATPRLRSRAWDGGAEDAVAATDPCGEIELVEGAEFDAPALRYAVTGLTRPWEVRERGGDGEETALKRQILPSGYDPSAYVSTRLHARAADGAEVPISLVRRADRPPDGTAPLLLHAYGAYGDSVAPTFSSHRLSLL